MSARREPIGGFLLAGALVLVLALSLFLAPETLTGLAAAMPAQNTNFPLSGMSDEPDGITAGTEGNLWFTERGAEQIGRITPEGKISEFSLKGKGHPEGITAGTEGNLWFTVARERGEEEVPTGSIDRITPGGVITEFFLAGEASTGSITTGAEGNLWFTVSGGEIGRITPNGGITEFPLPGSRTAWSIASGPEGRIWFGQHGEVGSMTPSGAVTEYPLPGEKGVVEGITAGPDGNVWFTERIYLGIEAGGEGRIGRITPGGTITEFPQSSGARFSGFPGAITAGPEGDIWFTDPTDGGFRGPNGDAIGRITTGGRIAIFEPNPGTGTAAGIAVGPDGNLWVTTSSDLLYVPVFSAIARVITPPPEALMIGIASFWATLHSHWVRIWLECEGGPPGASCNGMLRLKVGHGHVDLVTRSYLLPWETNRAVAFRLNPRAIRLLARTPVLSSRLTATVSGGQGAARRIALLR